jgi:peptide deformylase
MGIRIILQDDATILREVAQPVVAFDHLLRELAEDMLETMAAAKGIGLAAPQVNVPTRLIVARFQGRQLVMCNPTVLRRSGQRRGIEGCLSVQRGRIERVVVRAASVYVSYQELTGVRGTTCASDQMAAILQHEMDHLDGVLFLDRAASALVAPMVPA